MKFEDTKGAIRRRKLEDRQYNGQKRDKTMVHKTLNFEKHEPHRKTWVIPGFPLLSPVV